MKKTLSLRYLDTCTSDYFQGFAGNTYAVSINGKMRNAEVLQALHMEIDGTELYFKEFIPSDENYQELHFSANDIFSTADGRKTFSQYAGDETYAYFGVIITESED
jgi:hypothetical protein